MPTLATPLPAARLSRPSAPGPCSLARRGKGAGAHHRASLGLGSADSSVTILSSMPRSLNVETKWFERVLKVCIYLACKLHRRIYESHV